MKTKIKVFLLMVMLIGLTLSCEKSDIEPIVQEINYVDGEYEGEIVGDIISFTFKASVGNNRMSIEIWHGSLFVSETYNIQIKDDGTFQFEDDKIEYRGILKSNGTITGTWSGYDWGYENMSGKITGQLR